MEFIRYCFGEIKKPDDSLMAPSRKKNFSGTEKVIIGPANDIVFAGDPSFDGDESLKSCVDRIKSQYPEVVIDDSLRGGYVGEPNDFIGFNQPATPDDLKFEQILNEMEKPDGEEIKEEQREEVQVHSTGDLNPLQRNGRGQFVKRAAPEGQASKRSKKGKKGKRNAKRSKK